MAQWRNWYTRHTQNVVGETPCGFESHLSYKKVFDFLNIILYICTKEDSYAKKKACKQGPRGSENRR